MVIAMKASLIKLNHSTDNKIMSDPISEITNAISDEVFSTTSLELLEHDPAEMIDRQLKELAGILVEYYLSRRDSWETKT